MKAFLINHLHSKRLASAVIALGAIVGAFSVMSTNAIAVQSATSCSNGGITVDPCNIARGGEGSLIVSGFAPRAAVLIQMFGPSPTTPDVQGADAHGDLLVPIVAPDRAGDYAVEASGQDPGGRRRDLRITFVVNN